MSESTNIHGLNEPPNVIIDKTTLAAYDRLGFLGKGGFAKCYEIKRKDTGDVFAGKVVSKTLLKSDSQRQKMVQEVRIQKSLSHPNIVKLIASFEDNDFVYVVMELCRRKSLMELHRRRKQLSEPEARYYTKQILNACCYLHSKKIIHRDLKLGNVFLNDTLEIKVGDFGLATQLEHDNEKKKTMCGTPNYIAPEILNKNGHSYQVDVWSVGCIVYTLLVGSPPFETKSLRDTYRKIRKGEYYMPEVLSQHAKEFISRLLNLEPSARPTMDEALKEPWLNKHFIPIGLPVSALTTMPCFDDHTNEGLTHAPSWLPRRPLSEVNPLEERPISSGGSLANNVTPLPTHGPKIVPKQEAADRESIGNLYRQLLFLLDERNPILMQTNAPLSRMDEWQDPSSAPIYWVSKWVDYSDKYGLGYQLCDNSVGVLFNDHSRMLMTRDERIFFISSEGLEHRYTSSNMPSGEMEKKLRLIKHFRGYMEEYLLMAGENQSRPDVDDMIRLPYMSSWFRTQNAIVMHLSNGTLQVNIFHDHTKLILCPLMSAVTYIDKARNFTTYRFDHLQTNGVARELEERLIYTKQMIEQMILAKQNQGRGAAEKR